MTQATQPARTPQTSRRLRLWLPVILLILIGFGGALSIVCGLSATYRYYFYQSLFFFLPTIHPLGGLILFLAAIVLLVYVIRRADSVITLPPWRKMDFLVLTLLVIHVLILCFVLLRYFRVSDAFLFLSAVAYLAPILLLAEGVARRRDKRLLSTCYWLRFFKVYPLNTRMGLLMGLLLAFGIIIPFVAYSQIPTDLFGSTAPALGSENLYPFSAVLFGTRASLVMALLLLALFALCAVSYYCYYLLSLSDELAAKYERANEEKIRAERFKSELITNVSHDIRTPLTAIISYVDLLKSLEIEDPKFREYVEVLDRKSARLGTLTNDLLEASKASTGNVHVELCNTDLTEFIGQIAGEFDDQFVEKDLTLVFTPPEQPVWVQADARALWRVLENLFGNAFKYSLPGTRVFAEITLVDGAPEFSLKNVSQAPLNVQGDKLIEQFIRGDRARSTDGNGLGLYIAKSLSEVMGAGFAVHTSGDLFEARIRFSVGI